MLRWGHRGPDGTVDGGVAIPNHGKRPSMDIALYDAQKVSADAKAPQLADGASLLRNIECTGHIHTITKNSAPPPSCSA